MRLRSRVSPDEASEGPTSQHQDTGQGKSEEAAWELGICGRHRVDMSRAAPFTQLLHLLLGLPLGNGDTNPNPDPPQG